MGYRHDIDGRGLALSCDKTTTGARLISSIPLANFNVFGFGVIRKGDKITPCPACGKTGSVVEGEGNYKIHGVPAAVDRCMVICGCPPGSNRIIAPVGQWLGKGPSPEQVAREKHAAMLASLQAAKEYEEKKRAEERDRNRVFAKSCLRGDGCNDAGDGQEPHTNFAEMGFFRAAPVADAVTDSDAPQRAQTTKKKKPVAPEDVPEQKKRSALWKWWNGNHEEMDYKMAVAGAAATQRALATTAGANVLEQIGGKFATRGTWAVRAAGMAATGPGAAVAGLLVGMMPGKLNEGEQDFITPILLEQIAAKRGTAPSRVRYTWEDDGQGNVAPRGWHTPPGQDGVRTRKMEWDSRYQAYSFTTEEEPRITIIWTPDSVGMDLPSHTGNQNPVRIPNPIFINPLPEEDGVTAIATPVPEAKTFADYILWTPIEGVPPIYIYLSKPPVEFMDVELYSDFKRRSRQGKYEADHMPSSAAVKAHFKRLYPDADGEDLDAYAQDVASIVIPKEIHQKVSETYGGRNTPAQIELDSQNLRAALDRNLDAIKPALKEHGATEGQIEAARSKMHRLNESMGLYE